MWTSGSQASAGKYAAASTKANSTAKEALGQLGCDDRSRDIAESLK